MTEKASRWRTAAARVRSELGYYRRLYTHPRTPWLARVLLGLAIAYLVSPVDLIPDFIPVLGYLDDLLLVPGLIWLATACIPGELRAEVKAASALRADPD